MNTAFSVLLLTIVAFGLVYGNNLNPAEYPNLSKIKSAQECMNALNLSLMEKQPFIEECSKKYFQPCIRLGTGVCPRGCGLVAGSNICVTDEFKAYVESTSVNVTNLNRVVTAVLEAFPSQVQCAQKVENGRIAACDATNCKVCNVAELSVNFCLKNADYERGCSLISSIAKNTERILTAEDKDLPGIIDNLKKTPMVTGTGTTGGAASLPLSILLGLQLLSAAIYFL